MNVHLDHFFTISSFYPALGEPFLVLLWIQLMSVCTFGVCNVAPSVAVEQAEFFRCEAEGSKGGCVCLRSKESSPASLKKSKNWAGFFPPLSIIFCLPVSFEEQKHKTGYWVRKENFLC